jgi:hypothetical protein
MDLRKPPPTEPPPYSSDFLLAEFSALQERVANYEEIKSSRVNFFLVVVAAVAAGLPTLLEQYSGLRPSIAAASSGLLLALGLITLDQLVDYSISIVLFHQRAGRIRRWYVAQDPALQPHVAFAASDDQPSLIIHFAALVFRGADAIVLFINCLTAALLVMALTLARLPLFSPGSLALGGGCAVVAWYLQKGWIRFKLGRAAKQHRHDARFPDELSVEAAPPPRRRNKK